MTGDPRFADDRGAMGRLRAAQRTNRARALVEKSIFKFLHY